MSETDLGELGVLITRPRLQAQELAARLESCGGRPLLCPVIAIAPPLDREPLVAAARALASYDAVLFTSANAVDALFEHVPAGSVSCFVAAVGTATEQALERRGVRTDLLPVRFNADGLLAALVERFGDELPNMRFLFPRAEEGRETLPSGLLERGAQVDLVVAYRTVPADEEGPRLVEWLTTGAIDLLTFASPSAVDMFCRILERAETSGDARPPMEIARELPSVCIGPVTARRARERGIHVACVPERSDVSGMLEAICSLSPAR